MGIDKSEASVGLAKVVRVLLEGSNDFRKSGGAAEAAVLRVASRIHAGGLWGTI